MKLREQILKEYSGRSLKNFVQLAWPYIEPNELEWAPHMDLICDALEERFKQWKNWEKKGPVYDDIIINVPPGSSKSLICSVIYPIWCWINYPNCKILCYSYSYTIAEALSQKRLNLLQSPLVRPWFCFMRTANLQQLQTAKNGYIYTSSVGSNITGLHFDILIGDDPNSSASLYSISDREATGDYVLKILPSRKTNVSKSFNIYVQQRMHHDDVTGKLLELSNRKYKHIIVPAIKDDGTTFCERFPLDYLAQIKEQLGTKAFNAQYQQITSPDEGGIIKRDWIQYVNANEIKNNKLIWFLDSAYGLTNSDDNALVGCYIDNNKLYIKKCYVNKYDFPKLISFLKETLEPNALLYVEGKASGKSIIQTLKNEKLNVVEIQPKGSKMERKHAVSPFFEAGRVMIYDQIDNKSELLYQLITDEPKHDDISDVIIYAIDKLLKTGAKPTILFLKK